MEDLKLNESLSCKYNDVKGCRSLLSVCLHTVAVWIFTFHKISGFVWVILKDNYKQLYKPKVSISYLKNQIYYSQFSSIFCRICQIQCFLRTDAAI